MSGRRLRIAGVAALIAGAAALVGGVAHALLTANGSGSGFASTGSVALTVNSSATHTCAYPSLAPGDLTGSGNCQLAVTYSGSLSAYVSLTVQIQAKAGSGGAALYNGSNTSGLTLSISDGHHSFLVPTGAGATGGSCPTGYTCWTAANDLAATYSGSTPTLTFTSGSAATWTVTPVFPRTSGNPFQGGQALVTLTAQAVQGSPANPLPASCTTSTIGTPCAASGGFTWS